MGDFIISLISNITAFITYFAPGYLLIACYNFTACRQREKEIEYLIIKSISLSYLLFVFVSYIGKSLKFDTTTIQFFTFILAVIVGLVFGRINRTNWINNISLFLFKREVTNSFFVELWKKAYGQKSVVCLTIQKKNKTEMYSGQVYKVSFYNTYPLIYLKFYTCYDEDGIIVSDCSDNADLYLLISYDDIEHFEFELIPSTNLEAGND